LPQKVPARISMTIQRLSASPAKSLVPTLTKPKTVELEARRNGVGDVAERRQDVLADGSKLSLMFLNNLK